MERIAPTSQPARRAKALLARACALAPLIEGEASAAEEAGRLTPKSVEALRDAELLLGCLPREIGGVETALTTLLEIIEEVARQDGSAGWCFGMNAFITGMCAAKLSDRGLERVFSQRAPGHTWIAGGFPPQGRAHREGSDWRVDAHCRFGSGAHYSDAMCCTVVEFEGEAPVMDGAIPRMRSFVVPREALRLDDNWQVAGLEGTGSVDYHIDNALLADELSFVSSSPDVRRGRPLYSIPLLSLAGVPHAGFALGVGKRALEEIAALADGRQRLGSASRLANRGAFQQGYARARTRLQAARALVVESLESLAAASRTPEGVTIEQRAACTAGVTHAYESALEAAAFSFRAAGGAALYRDQPLQRCLRDLQAGAQHIVVSDESWERLDQLWLGVAEPGML